MMELSLKTFSVICLLFLYISSILNLEVENNFTPPDVNAHSEQQSQELDNSLLETVCMYLQKDPIELTNDHQEFLSESDISKKSVVSALINLWETWSPRLGAITNSIQLMSSDINKQIIELKNSQNRDTATLLNLLELHAKFEKILDPDTFKSLGLSNGLVKTIEENSPTGSINKNIDPSKIITDLILIAYASNLYSYFILYQESIKKKDDQNVPKLGKVDNLKKLMHEMTSSTVFFDQIIELLRNDFSRQTCISYKKYIESVKLKNYLIPTNVLSWLNSLVAYVVKNPENILNLCSNFVMKSPIKAVGIVVSMILLYKIAKVSFLILGAAFIGFMLYKNLFNGNSKQN